MTKTRTLKCWMDVPRIKKSQESTFFMSLHFILKFLSYSDERGDIFIGKRYEIFTKAVPYDFQHFKSCLMYSQMLTLVRFTSHLLMGIIVGLVYWFCGNDADVVIHNVGLLFFSQLFILFASATPTVVTC